MLRQLLANYDVKLESTDKNVVKELKAGERCNLDEKEWELYSDSVRRLIGSGVLRYRAYMGASVKPDPVKVDVKPSEPVVKTEEKKVEQPQSRRRKKNMKPEQPVPDLKDMPKL